MRNKKICFIIGIFLFAGVISLIIPQTRADTGIYEQRTDWLNPFLFEVDTIYTTTDGYFHCNGTQTYYFQVYLEVGKYYAIYISGGAVCLENMLIEVDNGDYAEWFYETSMRTYLLFINPYNTGLCNFRLIDRQEGRTTMIGTHEMGVLEIPIIQLDTEFGYDYWDTSGSLITLGIMELDSKKQYQTGHDGILHDYSALEIYCTELEYLFHVSCLDGSHKRVDFTAQDIITTSKLSEHGGYYDKYLFYSLNVGSFSLMEIEQPAPPDLGIIIWIIILSIVGIISIVGIYKYKTSKRKSDELIPRWTKKIEAPEGKKYCSNCGQEIKKETTFCEFCGSKQ